MQSRTLNEYQIDLRDDSSICTKNYKMFAYMVKTSTLNVPSIQKLRVSGKLQSVDERTRIEYPTTLTTFSLSKYDSTSTICIGFDGMLSD